MERIEAQTSTSARSAGGAVVLNTCWIAVASLLLLFQTLALLFVALRVPLNQVPCNCDDSGTTAVALDVAAAGKPSQEREDACFMGGIFKEAPPMAQGRRFVIPHVYGADQSFFPKNFTPFSEILCSSRSEKQVHRYGHMYSEYLDALRLQQDEVNMLEIGLKDGDSLNLWLQAFPKGKIYGLDAFYSNPTKHANTTEVGRRMTIFKGNQEDVSVLRKIVKWVKDEVGSLDFIVDDGGHTMRQQITSFTHLLPLVRPGGLYFIEDLQTSYWAKKCHHYYNGEPYCYGGGPPGAKNTTIDLIKSIIDVLNADFMEDHNNMGVIGSGTYHINPVDSLVGSVHCWRNMCALRRKYEDASF